MRHFDKCIIIFFSRVQETLKESLEKLLSQTEFITQERDMAMMHLANTEAAFSDVHR